MRDAVIVGAVRSPLGKARASGALHAVHPVDLLAHSLRALITRTGLDPALVDDVIAGCVGQVDEQAMNIGRWASLAAGLPDTVPATTIDRQCGSSQQAVHFAAQGVIAGAYDFVIAAGVESMSRVPMMSNVRAGADPFGPQIARGIGRELTSQGIAAERIAQRWGLDRVEMDAFALESHRKAAAAAAAGHFDDEIAPIAVAAAHGETRLVDRDEQIRPETTMDALASLRPAFYDPESARRFPDITWQVTAGNSSPMNDGSAALLITTSDLAARHGLAPLARVRDFAVAGSDPSMMLTAIMPATQKLLARSRIGVADVDLFEVNEAFASVVLAWQRDTGVDPASVNVAGGALALGHPLGASGARIMTTLVHTMQRTGARLGLQTMCEAGGLANATLLERV